MNYREGSDGISNCQVGNKMRSIDLIDCQEGRGEILDFQVSKGCKTRLSKSLKSSEVSSYRQGVLIEGD
jgi:hypothetical protein